MNQPKSILFLGETYRADAQTWIKGIELASGVAIDTLEVKSTTSRTGRLLKFFTFGIRVLKTNLHKSYDLVLAERATSYGFFSLLVNAKKRVVAQQGITDAWPEDGWSGVYKRFLQRIVYRYVDLIHAWGEVMVPAILNSGANPNKIMILPKGIDLENYSPGGKKISNLAIVTRSLTPVYQHEKILHALAILKSEGVYLQLKIVGDGPLTPFLKEKTKKLGLENQVEFLGRIPNILLPKLLENSGLYLSFPKTEGVSASLFEAMASGCFPIVSDLPGTRAFINDKENGILVPSEDPEALAKAVNFYLNNSDLAARAREYNRSFVEKHADLKKNMKQIWNRYCTVFLGN
ncbi:protein involved in gliding motility RemC [Algoriphagus aquaeductus]|uniref:Protein involved in gliding motility RemC n=1 Tax=Algoriphagus aquaeductus TaxID=475299 RepID=A0A326RQ22_9BACT|nr:glycosyltransferase [Algoriphagus aquaeductus]PZV79134.1 protein involved in gliding motility RemC [Algoriphagus aquaeductus]